MSARVLVFTDRAPDDSDWKGAFTWRTILSLAECQHEVLVATPLDFDQVHISHPRLNVIRPIHSWRADQLPKVAKTLLSFRPDVVHTFALRFSRLWPSLSLWRYLAAFPSLRKITTLFDAEDCLRAPAACEWYKSASRLTVFSEIHRHEISKILARTPEILPLELELGPDLARESVDEEHLIPAPVSEWRDPESAFRHLADFLRHNPHSRMSLIGGWGEVPQVARKNVWRELGDLATRLTLTEPLNFPEYLARLHGASGVWLEPLKPDSWRFLLSSQLARQLGKRLIVSSPLTFALNSGSTANSLSRLYTGL